MRLSLLPALAISLVSTVFAGDQAPPALTDALKAHLKGDQLQVVTSLRGLPLGVRDALGGLIGGQYTDFADPEAPFRTGAEMNPSLPMRRLVTAGCSNDHHCLVYYEKGGATRTFHVAVFQWRPESTRLEFGGSAPGGLKTVEAVRNAIVAGTIKAAGNSW